MSVTFHEATRKKYVEIAFHCASCGIEKQVRITAVGKGFTKTSSLPGGADEAQTAAGAASLARADVLTVAEQALDLVPCPSCKRRASEPGAWFRTPIVAAVTAAGIVGGALSCAGAAYLNAALLAIGLTLMCLSLPMLGVYRDRARRALAAAQTATFSERRPKQIAGSACVHCRRAIVMQSEGRRCEECQNPVHIEECLPAHVAAAHRTTAPFR